MNQRTPMILVEGVPFTGKSTTSEYIATQLDLNRYPAHWVPEGMMLQHYFPHVLAVLKQQQTISETVLWAEWSAFVAAALAAPTTFVVDSALSYAAVYPLLMADRPVAAIHAVLRQIAELCVPLQPRVIHLVGDVEQLVPASIIERGEGWREHLVGQAEASPYQRARGRSGVAGATSFMHDAQLLLRAILAPDDWPTLTLDVTVPNWAAHRRAILAFLKLDELPIHHPELARSVLQSYIGAYAPEDSEQSEDLLSVRLEHNMLALHGPNMRYGTLLPVSAARFHLQGTALDIEFVVEDGLTRRLTLLPSEGKEQGFRRV